MSKIEGAIIKPILISVCINETDWALMETKVREKISISHKKLGNKRGSGKKVASCESHRDAARVKRVNTRAVIGAREALLLHGFTVIGINTACLAPRIEWSRSVNAIEFNPRTPLASDRNEFTKYFVFA